MPFANGRCKKVFFTLTSLFTLSSSSNATVLINVPDPLPQHVMGDSSYTLTIGGSDGGSPASGANYNATKGYRFINTTSGLDGDLVWLDVSTNQNLTVNTGQHIVATLSLNTTTGSEIPLIGAGIVTTNVAPSPCGTGSNCQGIRNSVSTYLSAAYNSGSVLRVSFRVADLCATTGASGSLCASSPPKYDNFGGGGATLTQPISVTFSVVSDSNVTGAISGTNIDSGSFTLAITDVPPTMACPVGAISDYYFPGDQQIYVTPSNYGTSVGNGTGTGSGSYVGANLTDLLLLADRNAVSPIVSNQIQPNEVISYLDAQAGTQAVTGFVNTSNGSNNGYQVSVYAQNEVGIVSPTACSFPSSAYSQPIKGVLTESKCFIATAAYHDGRAAPVMMLRRFRDQILSKTEFGRKFIENYYRYSPALAEWAWDKPLIRAIALRALVPVELLAWGMLKFASADEASPQPYIDRVKAQLNRDQPEGKSADGYTEALKKKLPPSSDDQSKGYSEQVKAKLEPAPSAEGYVESERAKLPPPKNAKSIIEEVQSGHDHLPIPERPPIKQAVGFMVGVSPGAEVLDTASSVPFSSVYGSGWKPEFILHYEHQVVHSENFGSFGLGIDTGISYADGYGQLTYPFNGTTVSQTKFAFLQFPVLASAYYRFNLLRVLRPYVGASAGSIFFMESRKDGVSDKRGASLVYATRLGVSLLLDFFDSTTAKDGYLSLGVQHSYLVAEFLYLSSFNSTGVIFGRSGIYSGFLFEI